MGCNPFKAVKDFIDDTVEMVIDVVEGGVEIVSDFVEETLEELFDFIKYSNIELFGTLNQLTGDNGIFDFALDMNRSSHATWTAAAGGDLNAILAIASVGVAMMAGAYHMVYGGVFDIISGISNIYTQATQMIANGQMILSVYLDVLRKGNYLQNAMNLAFVNSWINGSANMWMAGGVLYDSPKAGNILFEPTGDLNTTRFLNAPNKNSNTWIKWTSGKMHELQKTTFGNLAGNEFFAVSPLAQRI